MAIAGKQIPCPTDVEAALETLAKRGPDDRGVMQFNNCLLGHTRLSILDVEGGHQPMQDDLRNIAITFNGEIYNYRELRGDLQARGHRFLTHSDTEVILKAYVEYGHACVRKIDGMFSFALWDEAKKSLFLARDRFGKKPLYYTVANGTIFAASELKALRAFGLTEQLNLGALDNYLCLRYIPAWKSIYNNIFQILPAHSAVFSQGELHTPQRYWEPDYEPLVISYGEAKEELNRLLNAAIKKRLLASDVEIGAFLSGGVDSTSVSVIASKFLNHPLKTFSLGYGGYNDELKYANQAAQYMGSEQYLCRVTTDQIPEELQKTVAYFDEPHAGTSNFPQHLLSELASTKVKVVLSGDGGDELFFGYPWYAHHVRLPQHKKIFEKLFYKPYHEQLKTIGAFSAIERAALWGSGEHVNQDFLTNGSRIGGLGLIQKANIFDLGTHLPGQHLARIDRMGMMHGLEVRSPFLDTALAEFVLKLPIQFKITKYEQKIILKDLLAEYMPREFVYRRKTGFDAPITRWLKEEETHKFVQNQLGATAKIRSLFQPRVVDLLLNNFYHREHDSYTQARQLWTLLCLEVWMRSF